MHCKSISMSMASLDPQWILICLLVFLITVTQSLDKSERDMSIDEYINHVNPPAVHKFEDKNGDAILCVLYADQISLQGSERPYVDTEEDQHTMSALNFSCKCCPNGTVPIIETKREDVERAGSVSNYISKTPESVNVLTSTGDNLGHEYAVARYQSLQPIYIASAGLNVWQPTVVTADNGIFSLSQIWLVHEGNLSETIEVGWMVNTKLFGKDPRPRLFVYWTSDSYGNSGCWNLKCRGFVLARNPSVFPGQILHPVSTYNGAQYQISVKVAKIRLKEGISWALFVFDKLIGWWPGKMFQNLEFNRVDMGGEVAFGQGVKGSPFTKTHMGSGYFPKTKGYSHAAHVRDIQIYDKNGDSIDAPANPIVGRPKCYNISFPDENLKSTYFFYGGPGGDNEQCVY